SHDDSPALADCRALLWHWFVGLCDSLDGSAAGPGRRDFDISASRAVIPSSGANKRGLGIGTTLRNASFLARIRVCPKKMLPRQRWLALRWPPLAREHLPWTNPYSSEEASVTKGCADAHPPLVCAGRGDYGAAGADVEITPPGASGRTIQRIT